jgi:hypothetical protein
MAQQDWRGLPAFRQLTCGCVIVLNSWDGSCKSSWRRVAAMSFNPLHETLAWLFVVLEDSGVQTAASTVHDSLARQLDSCSYGSCGDSALLDVGRPLSQGAAQA